MKSFATFLCLCASFARAEGSSHSLELVDPDGNVVGIVGDGTIERSIDENGKTVTTSHTGFASCLPRIHIQPTGAPEFKTPLQEMVKRLEYKVILDPPTAGPFLGFEGNYLMFPYRAKPGKVTFKFKGDDEWFTWKETIPICSKDGKEPDLIKRPYK